MKIVFVTAVVMLASCVDPLCGATEQPGKMSIRRFIEEESFVKRCEPSSPTDLFNVDEAPLQEDLARTLVSAPLETYDVGDYDISPGSYVQCTSVGGGEIGGLCSAFTLGDGDGVVVMQHFAAPDFSECYTTRDAVRYESFGPVAHE
jgi:hypothetical protein